MGTGVLRKGKTPVPIQHEETIILSAAGTLGWTRMGCCYQRRTGQIIHRYRGIGGGES